MLVQYIRDRKQRPVGVVVAYRSNQGLVKVGYSKCNPEDHFDKREGLNMALKRAVPVDTASVPVYAANLPQSVRSTFEIVAERALRRLGPRRVTTMVPRYELDKRVGWIKKRPIGNTKEI